MFFWLLDERVLVITAFALLLLAAEIGFRAARARRVHADPRLRDHIAVVQSALMGLLALLLGFAFAMAMSRFDVRQQLVLDEADAIGTAYLRTDFLTDADRSESRRLLRAYLDARYAFFAAGADEAGIARADGEGALLQRSLWTIAARAAREQPGSAPVALYLESLDDVIDISGARLDALDNHIPQTAIVLVLALAAASMYFIGFGCGIDDRRRLRSTATVALMLVLSLAVVLDLDRPRRGLVHVSQASLVALQGELARDP
jgi:hypothetical protein